MTREYGRKPYISKSYHEMMTRVPNKAEWNQRLVKQSEFEKPYKDDSYSDMQHYWPTNHIPGADYPGMPIEGMPSSGRPSTRLQWWGCEGSIFEKYSSGDCLGVGETATVEFKENTVGGPGFGGDPIVDYKADHPLRIVSIAKEQATELTSYLYVTVTLGESTTASSLTITATTESGETCTASVNLCTCTPDAGMAWDSGTSAETIAQSETATIAVTGNNSPFRWSVSGTGFTVVHGITDSLTNTLSASSTACGTATITVIGCDGVSVTGDVRCTTGTWVWVSDDAVDPCYDSLTCLPEDETCPRTYSGEYTCEAVTGGTKKIYTFHWYACASAPCSCSCDMGDPPCASPVGDCKAYKSSNYKWSCA